MLQRFFVALGLVVAIALLMKGGAGATDRTKVVIGVDPSWYPVDVLSKETNLTAFSKELLEVIGNNEEVYFDLRRVSSENLIKGLYDGEFDGVLTAMQPGIVTEGRFHLSDSFLNTGPLLVVLRRSGVQGMTELLGKPIGIPREASNYIGLLSDGVVEIVTYQSMTLALEALMQEEITAVMMPALQAEAYVKGSYRGVIRIATTPFNEEGFRLVLAKREDREPVEAFNRGLEALRESGEYDKLLKRWDLP